MSIPLLKSELKSNSKIIVLFLAVITLYAGIITAMYDTELGAGINELAKSMPQFFAVFGMKNPGTTPVSYTHLDVYKRQAGGLGKGGVNICFQKLPM